MTPDEYKESVRQQLKDLCLCCLKGIEGVPRREANSTLTAELGGVMCKMMAQHTIDTQAEFCEILFQNMQTESLKIKVMRVMDAAGMLPREEPKP